MAHYATSIKIVIVIILIYIISDIWSFYQYQNDPIYKEVLLVSRDYDTAGKFSMILTELQDSSGYDVGNNLDDLMKSAYYPYRINSTGFFSNPISIRLVESEGVKHRELTILGKYKHESKFVMDLCESPDTITRLRLHSYLMGVNKRSDWIQYIHSEFFRYLHHETYQRRNNQLMKPEFDLPRNNQQLKQYIDWVKYVEGSDTLCDGWGRPLLFAVKNNTIICRSSGPNGIFDDKDDIVEKCKVH